MAKVKTPITLAVTQVAKVPLTMLSEEGRNWEGIVSLYDLGFLIATDKHPSTFLGFVRIDLDK